MLNKNTNIMAWAAAEAKKNSQNSQAANFAKLLLKSHFKKSYSDVKQLAQDGNKVESTKVNEISSGFELIAETLNKRDDSIDSALHANYTISNDGHLNFEYENKESYGAGIVMHLSAKYPNAKNLFIKSGKYGLIDKTLVGAMETAIILGKNLTVYHNNIDSELTVEEPAQASDTGKKERKLDINNNNITKWLKSKRKQNLFYTTLLTKISQKCNGNLKEMIKQIDKLNPESANFNDNIKDFLGSTDNSEIIQEAFQLNHAHKKAMWKLIKLKGGKEAVKELIKTLDDEKSYDFLQGQNELYNDGAIIPITIEKTADNGVTAKDSNTPKAWYDPRSIQNHFGSKKGLKATRAKIVDDLVKETEDLIKDEGENPEAIALNIKAIFCTTSYSAEKIIGFFNLNDIQKQPIMAKLNNDQIIKNNNPNRTEFKINTSNPQNNKLLNPNPDGNDEEQGIELASITKPRIQ